MSEQGTTQALVRHEAASMPDRTEINTLGLLANTLAKSGFFKDSKGGVQAFAKLVFGRDLGLSATAAMTGVHIVEGKPEIGANIQAQMVRSYIGPEGERYDYKILTHTDEVCEIRFSRRRDGEWHDLGVEEFTKENAETAELTKPTRNGAKSMYEKYPRNMLFARCMSNGVAFHCPEVTNGIRTYHEGEISGEQTNGNGQPAEPAQHVDLTEEQVTDAEVVEDPPAEEAANEQDQAAEQPQEPQDAAPPANEDDDSANEREALEARALELWTDLSGEKAAKKKIADANGNLRVLGVIVETAERTKVQKDRVTS